LSIRLKAITLAYYLRIQGSSFDGVLVERKACRGGQNARPLPGYVPFAAGQC